MKLLNILFNSISGKREENVKPKNTNITVDYLEIEKEKIEILKDTDAIKISFKLNIEYAEDVKNKEKAANAGHISFEGKALLSADKEESRELMKHWKKKEVPAALKATLFNALIKRCTPKALLLEEELNLPFHASIPQLRPQQQTTKE